MDILIGVTYVGLMIWVSVLYSRIDTLKETIKMMKCDYYRKDIPR